MKIVRLLLLPVSLIYGIVIIIRNFLYDRGILTSRKFNLPVVVVGNLEVGGSGKTPLIEYLVRLLKDHFKTAVLSRGYGRETTGFIRAEPSGVASLDRSSPDPAALSPGPAASYEKVSAARIGDEPFQYFSKFPDITVAVGEDRVAAVERLKDDHQVILLDDAFQHRSLIPGLAILVLDYNTLFRPRLLLPAGNYREPFSGRKRADILLVSKVPGETSEDEKERIIKRLKPAPGQEVCFSSLNYDTIKALDPAIVVPRLNGGTHVLLVTGIARPGPFLSHIKSITNHVRHLKYPDHHSFTIKNIAKIAEIFEGIDSADKVILTTEKDAARFSQAALKEIMQHLPVFYWPVRINIHEPGKIRFDNSILEYVTRH